MERNKADKKSEDQAIYIAWRDIELRKTAAKEQQVKEQSALGYELLRELLARYWQIDLSNETEPIARQKQGKPYLVYHPELHFSISHSGARVICALGQTEMGIDIQLMEERDYRKVARRVLNEEEWQRYEDSGYETARFIADWTRKESYLKYRGTGIACDLRALTYTGVRQIRVFTGDAYQCTLCVPSGWQGTIFLNGKADLPLFSV